MRGRTVFLIARRELNAKLRTRGFVISTAVSIVVLAVFVLTQSAVFDASNKSVVGLNGQAISVGGSLTAAAGRLGRQIETREITDLASGAAMVADGELDALVSGPPAGLQVLVKDELDQDLRVALDGIVAQQVLEAELAAVEDLDAGTVLGRITNAHVGVRTLEAPDPQRGQRLAIALLIIALLYFSLVLYGTMVAQGVIEEKSSRVVEILLSTVRPWQLLSGKVLGLGLVGLIQLAIIGVIGLVLGITTGALAISGVAAGSLLWGLVWYLLGYFLYATVFAAVGSLVSRQEDAQAVLTPITLVLVVAFVLGFSVLAQDASGTAATVLSLLPPFSPILMPGKIALGAAPGWQIALAIAFTLAAIALLTMLGARIYRNAVLHMGSRVRLRDAVFSSSGCVF
ncbi:MAG TPA: ABC transporter permease [Actinophytocola sp.]|uniref:ABC transporter permease n=1 Tax=Actinophytocola sp. TaxID=1872138 RepID=UPI002DDD3022|nr:ABC transporter permease [Actinophytocola sp.]HEV2781700.1 ABC transporter permease [Actinophytocola sp.]